MTTSADRAARPVRYRRTMRDLMDRVHPGDLTSGELRRLVAVLTEADDRIAGRKREPARVLQLVGPRKSGRP